MSGKGGGAAPDDIRCARPIDTYFRGFIEIIHNRSFRKGEIDHIDVGNYANP